MAVSKRSIMVMGKISARFDDAVKYFKNKKYLEKNITDYSRLPKDIFSDLRAVFVLSTGRSGTDLLTRLFKLNKSNFVLHEPEPDLVYAAREAYDLGSSGTVARRLGISSSRYHLFKECFLRNKVYIETNNKLTFFADALYQLLPNSRFIHLIRDPRAFVRSAIRRRYYQGHDFDDGRIVPADLSLTKWNSYSPIQKNGWLWNETNKVIESFVKDFEYDRLLTIQSEKLFKDPAVMQQISRFIGEDSSSLDQITQIIDRPVNQQIKNDYPSFDKWDTADQEDLISITPLGKKYGYWDQ